MKETWKLIVLLVLSVGGLLAYAFIPERIAERLPLKQVGLELLLGDNAAADNTASDTTVEEPVDTTSQRLLLFGDSMSSYLALRLADYANKNGHMLTCITWVGSDTHKWADTDTLQHYMRSVNPTHVFVCLGSNELYSADMKGCERRIRAILDKIGSVPTVWIGPPNWCEDKGYNRLLERVMGPQAYYPSYKLTFERQKDGRHPTMAASAMWIDKIVEWMNSGRSVHPFRMEKPDRKDRHYKQINIVTGGTKHKNSAGAFTDSISAATAEPSQAGENAALSPKSADETKPVHHTDSISK